jgi:hypothetical protein
MKSSGRLPAFSQAQSVPAGKTGSKDAILNAGDIVRYPVRFPNFFVWIVDGVRGARVVIARLADRTWIHNRSPFKMDAVHHF